MIFDSPSLKRFYKTTPITFLIALAVTIMFGVTILTGGFTSSNLLRLGALFTPSVYLEGDYYRLFTVMFLHGSVSHYIFNTLFGLVIISATLERLIGSWRFSLLYFGSGILASLTIYGLFLLNQQPTLGVGASGAIYGVLGAFLFITYKRPEWFSRTDTTSIRGLIIINIIFTIIVPNISVAAHLGGLAAGFLLSYLLTPKNRPSRGARAGFANPYQDEYDPFNRPDPFDDDDPFKNIEDVTIVDDDDDPEDPWGRYS